MFRLSLVEKVLLPARPDLVMAVGDVGSTPAWPLHRLSKMDRGSDRKPVLWDVKALDRIFAGLSRKERF